MIERSRGENSRTVARLASRCRGAAMGMVRAIVRDFDTRPVELLTAQLSLWFAFVLLTSDATYRPVPFWLWSLWCAVAGLAKLLGLGASFDPHPPRWSRWARLLGTALGTAFWIVLTTVLFLLLRGGISWGGYAIIAAAQGWACWRLYRDCFRPGRC